MISTTIEQGKHLVELGLDTKTADMVWTVANPDLPMLLAYPIEDCNSWEDKIPAWSLSALLEVMRKLHAVVTLQVTELSKLSIWLRIKDFGFIWKKDIQTQNPMDAVYGGMLWLLEQGLIEKEDNDE